MNVKTGGICRVGERVFHKGVKKVVMDVDNINQSAKIGEEDLNRLVFDSHWTPWSEIFHTQK